MRCPNCSANVKPGANVCEYCQTEFPKETPKETPPPSQQAPQFPPFPPFPSFPSQGSTNPQFNQPIKKKSNGCLIAFLIFVGVFVLISILASIIVPAIVNYSSQIVEFSYDYDYDYDYDYNNDYFGDVTTETVPPEPIITLEQFQKLENGMTYDEVVAIIGNEGELNSETGEGEYQMTMYSWVNHYSVGGNVVVSFRQGKLFSKAQSGLK